MQPVYLDYNATTPVDPQVLEAMLPYLRDEFGNPSSSYALGRRAQAAVEQARAQVAELIKASPDEIIFTSGATEASNLAIRGAAAMHSGRPNIVTSNIEHAATAACCALLERSGHEIRRVPTQANGTLSCEDIAAAIDVKTAVVTIIHAQNEIGTLQPISDIAARKQGALLHIDAAQSVGKIPVSVQELGVDLLTIAGHKLYAPKGVGALYIRRGVSLHPVVVGAGQERGIRPGTENVAFIVGLGAACAIATRTLEASQKEMMRLSAKLLAGLQSAIPGLVLVGGAVRRLPNTLNVLFPGVDGRRVLEACPAVLASTGSACHAGREEPSATLTAMGIAPDRARGAVRLSLGRQTTETEIDKAVAALAAAWRTISAEPAAASIKGE